jgi:hypothetical protein
MRAQPLLATLWIAAFSIGGCAKNTSHATDAIGGSDAGARDAAAISPDAGSADVGATDTVDIDTGDDSGANGDATPTEDAASDAAMSDATPGDAIPGDARAMDAMAGDARAMDATAGDAHAGDAIPVMDAATPDSGTNITVSIAPTNVGLVFPQTQAFQATVHGSTNNLVTWSVDGVAGGNATVGTISAAGTYAAPQAAGVHTIQATSAADPTKSATARAAVTDLAGVFTSHFDSTRTNQNPSELALDPPHVDSAQFGKLFSAPVDGYMYAQPLWVADVAIPGQGTHNVVYAATEHDSVYAYDADRSGAPLWHVSFLVNGATTVPAGDTGETGDLIPEIGITGTPVIDPQTRTLYVVAKTKENGSYVQRLHALDIATGQERTGSPVVIDASTAGNGPDSVNGIITFMPLLHMNRPALALANGIVYAAFGSHGDHNTYYGWVIGYDVQALARTVVYATSPDAAASAIWQTGAGPAIDPQGNVYIETANGNFDVDTGGRDYGDSVVKLSPMGAVLDYFTPADQAALNSGDIDLGSAGTIILPDQPGAHPHLAIATGKPGYLYLLDRDALGHYLPGGDTQIVQTVAVVPNTSNITGGIFANPAYWQGHVYIAGISDHLKRFDFANGLLSQNPVSSSTALFDYPGASISVSASGSTNGIVWLIEGAGYSPSAPATLHAYDALDLSRELYASNQAAGGRDTAGNAVKFTVPTIANGKVYVGTQTEITVYGLLP